MKVRLKNVLARCGDGCSCEAEYFTVEGTPARIGDITLREMKRFHKKYSNKDCDGCPLCFSDGFCVAGNPEGIFGLERKYKEGR